MLLLLEVLRVQGLHELDGIDEGEVLEMEGVLLHNNTRQIEVAINVASDELLDFADRLMLYDSRFTLDSAVEVLGIRDVHLVADLGDQTVKQLQVNLTCTLARSQNDFLDQIEHLNSVQGRAVVNQGVNFNIFTHGLPALPVLRVLLLLGFHRQEATKDEVLNRSRNLELFSDRLDEISSLDRQWGPAVLLLDVQDQGFDRVLKSLESFVTNDINPLVRKLLSLPDE